MMSADQVNPLVNKFIEDYNDFYRSYEDYVKGVERYIVGKAIDKLGLAIQDFYKNSIDSKAYALNVSEEVKKHVRAVLEDIYRNREKIDPLKSPKKSTSIAEWNNYLKKVERYGGDQLSIDNIRNAFAEFVDAAYSVTNLRFLKYHPNDFWDIFAYVENLGYFRRHRAETPQDKNTIESILQGIKNDFEQAIISNGTIQYDGRVTIIHFEKNVIDAYNEILAFLNGSNTRVDTNDSYEAQTRLKDKVNKLFEIFKTGITTQSNWKKDTVEKFKEAVQLFVRQQIKFDILKYQIKLDPNKNFTTTRTNLPGTQDLISIKNYIDDHGNTGELEAAFANIFNAFLEKIGATKEDGVDDFRSKPGMPSKKVQNFVKKMMGFEIDEQPPSLPENPAI